MNKIVKMPNGSFQMVSLTYDEQESGLNELITLNIRIMGKCENAVLKAYADRPAYNADDAKGLAIELFKKCGVQSYTHLSGVLDRKIHNMKNEQTS